MFSVNLTTAEIEAIHEYSLRILQEVGVQFNHAEGLKILGDRGADVKGERVYFPPPMVEEYIQLAPESFVLQAADPDNDVEIGKGLPVVAPAAQTLYIGQETGERRPAMKEDFLRLVKIIQDSCVFAVNSTAIVVPAAMNEAEFVPFSLAALLLLTDKPLLTPVSGGEKARRSIEMARIASARKEGNFILGMANANTPLIYDPAMIDGIIEFCRAGQPLGIASCGMAGSTAPVSLPGTLAVTNAELLAGLIFTQIINPGHPVIYGNTSAATDMKNMELLLGGPETALLNTASGLLAEYYGLPFRSGGGLTDSHLNDIKAGYESMMNLMVSFLSGVDFIMQAGGILDSFMTVSYEKIIVDEEIIGLAKRYFKGYDREELESSLAISYEDIKKRCPGGHFLDAGQTVMNFKKELRQPLFTTASVTEEARKIWQKRLENYRPPAGRQEIREELITYCTRELEKDAQHSCLQYLRKGGVDQV